MFLFCHYQFRLSTNVACDVLINIHIGVFSVLCGQPEWSFKSFFNRCHVSIHKVTVMILRKGVYNYIPQTIKLSHCLDFEFICVQLIFFLNFKSEFVMFLFKTSIIPEYQHVIFRFVVHKTSRYQIIYRRSRKWLQG